MTPAQQAKAAGLKSLAKASEISGVPTRTLQDWHKSKPQLFKVVIAGCLVKINQ